MLRRNFLKLGAIFSAIVAVDGPVALVASNTNPYLAGGKYLQFGQMVRITDTLQAASNMPSTLSSLVEHVIRGIERAMFNKSYWPDESTLKVFFKTPSNGGAYDCYDMGSTLGVKVHGTYDGRKRYERTYELEQDADGNYQPVYPIRNFHKREAERRELVERMLDDARAQIYTLYNLSMAGKPPDILVGHADAR
jgi:hypothetical protein